MLGATGQTRIEMHLGREHLVVPVVALIESVIHAINSDYPELVPVETLHALATSMDGKPVTIGHPKRNGTQCSAQHPEILAASGIGIIRNSRVVGKKLLCEALIETSKTKQLHPELYQRLANGATQEVSIGATVVTDRTPGTHNGRPFMASWVYADGDHLAFLPGGRGACSVESGCGTHRAATRIAPALHDHAHSELEDRMTSLEGKRHSASDRSIRRRSLSAGHVLDRLHSAGARVPGTSQQREADSEEQERAQRSTANVAPDSYKEGLAAMRAADMRAAALRGACTTGLSFEEKYKVKRAVEFETQCERMEAHIDAHPSAPRLTTAEMANYVPPDSYKEALAQLREAERRR